ncbi:MAG: N-acetyl-gamma-glutamyl-phosphate reductase [Verrucomicrobiae bacterium]|nr:N-acetyl-gamma-glutamyl-phosphate reductase [Verrucomicrobiae bacterium]MDW7979284.1 N-acetyl-gamma-glutamyl-phosphate reductase [Verrucomicrobiales bacterium]
MNTIVKAAVVGASGYSGEELVRLLLGHPCVELAAVTSRQFAGKTLAEVFPRFAHDARARRIKFVEPDAAELASTADVVFLALPHGVAAQFAAPLAEAGCRVIDLSADFRLRDPAVYKEFYGHDHPAPGLLAKAVYGLPEVYREQIKTARLIAAPGCYPTSVLIPTIPLLRAGLVQPSGIIASSLSGVSGAGRKTELEYLFCECNESLRPYSVPRHRHLSELEQELGAAAGTKVGVLFVPHLVPVNRGILTTLYLRPAGRAANTAPHDAVEQLRACYHQAYGTEPFVQLLDGSALPDTKNVVGTNYIQIAWRVDPRTGTVIVMSAIDNLVKGAAGQAVQAMNIMLGFDEQAGLK